MSRKYRLTLVLATQGIDQLSREAAFAVFTNCATLISFRVSGTDAARLEDEFSMVFPAFNLQDIADYKMYVRTLMYLGTAASPSGPHLVSAYPPFSKDRRNAGRDWIIRVSRQGHARRSSVDAKLTRFLVGSDQAD